MRHLMKLRMMWKYLMLVVAAAGWACGPLLVERDPTSNGGNLSDGPGCEEGSDSYAPGQTFAKDCNSCVCQSDGTILCTQSDCQKVPVCTFEGKGYAAGESFSQVCNNCVCQADGEIICTQRDCALLCSDGAPSTWVDTWAQAPAKPADILLVIDDSGSMAPTQATLSSAIGDFIAAANAAGGDFHIGVTTTHTGTPYLAPAGAGWPGQQVGGGLLWGTPKVVTPTTPTPVAVLSSAMRPGTIGNPLEKGLDAAVLAVDAPNATGPNAGFLRANTRFDVVFFSDEDDSSSLTPADFVAELKALTAPQVTVHAVVGVTDGLCPNGSTSVVAAGTRYAAAAALTGGVSRDLCDLPAQANSLATQLAQRIFPLENTRVLKHKLNPQSLPTVTVNGVALTSPADFTFDLGANTVVFSDAATPRPGQVVEVQFNGGCSP